MPQAQLSKAKPKNKLGKSVTFEFFAPQAKEVCLAGDFNRWDATRNRLLKGPDGKWKANLDLKSGRYEYRYLVDGDWENDQRPVECVPNTFGTWNCVIEVE